MNDDIITRMHYYPKQYLRTQDFTAEQAYHVAMRRRHNIAHHQWGIVQGLELFVENGSFSVLPGFAIDGYGRELIVPKRRPLPGSEFDDKGRDALDVWLVYDRQAGGQAAEGYAGCRPKNNRCHHVTEDENGRCNCQTNGNQPAGDLNENCNGSAPSPYRWQEYPILRVGRPDAASPDRRKPVQVPDGDIPFGASRTAPDDPNAEWPVFLGQIQRNRSEPTEPFSYRVDMDGRPYAGLVGEAVFSPSGRTWVQIGAEKDGDPYRFAVFIPEADKNNPRLDIDQSGNVGIQGATTMHGKLTMKGGAIALQAGIAETKIPWTIYRYNDNGQDQLRIQMEGAVQGKENRVVVGYWSAEENKFIPCLTVKDNCQVEINGDLDVRGRIEADSFVLPSFTLTAEQYLLTSALMGISGGGTLTSSALQSVGSGSFVDFLTNVCGSPLEQAEALLANTQGIQTLAAALLADEAGLKALAAELLGDQDGRAAMAEALLGDESNAKDVLQKIGLDKVKTWVGC